MLDIDVLEDVKGRFGYPHTIIEISDEDILRKVIHGKALTLFSKFYPRSVMLYLGDMDIDTQRRNVFKIPSSKFDKILDVTDVIDGGGDKATFTFDGVDSIRVFGEENTIEFGTKNHIVKINAVHKPDLSSINFEHEEIFVHTCMVELARLILPIRKHFPTISTPVGEIQLDIETPQALIDGWEEFRREYYYHAGTYSSRKPFRIA
jgi:hypothetical protein